MPPTLTAPRVAPHIRHARADGLVVILDLRAEDYSVLDETGSDMWELLAEGVEAEAAVAALARTYDATPDRLRSDLERFVADCERRGFLERAGAPQPDERAGTPPPDEPAAPRASSRTHARATRAWSTLLATKRELARGGLAAAYASCARLPAPDDASAPPDALRAALRSFLRAENAFVARAAPDDCLLRSLALYRFLRSAELPCEHRIGVRRFPFTAHAWVEHGGEALLDDTERTRGFTVLASLR